MLTVVLGVLACRFSLNLSFGGKIILLFFMGGATTLFRWFQSPFLLL